MNTLQILNDALNLIKVKDNFDDFDSQIILARVAELTKYDVDKLLTLSAIEYKKLFMALTNLLLIRYTTDKDYNDTITAIAFYSAYRCLELQDDTNEKIYDDTYSITNNLLFIYGHKNLVTILCNARNTICSHYNPLDFLDSNNFEQEVYIMEYVQLKNNPRITNSENLFIKRYYDVERFIPGFLVTHQDMCKLLRFNQEILYKYISAKVENGEHDF